MTEEKKLINPTKILEQTDMSDASYYHKNKQKIKIVQKE